MNKIISLLLLLILTGFNCIQGVAADVTLYVTRHGKTMFNSVHRAQGWADTPLTPAGAEVALRLGKGLRNTPFIAVWSSDAGRARETAQLIMQPWKTPLPLQELKGLREVGFGLYEGDLDRNMWSDAARQAGFASEEALMNAFRGGKIHIDRMINAVQQAEATGTSSLKGIKSAGQAESYQQVSSRMVNSLTEIAKQAQQQGGGNVLVVTHGMAIASLIYALGDTSLDHPLANASVTRLRYTDAGKFVIEAVDDQSYINGGS
ncbi:histidine phosphatase family protein [Pantoea sp. KPR_PJ]|uniref:histidine phosphatase family protein n=1 Tax=Pantoea sp. KPR_PJ TaxID=2738375 RepID=UPI0035282CB0